eukprot:1399667-Amphidinium_carterae.2
MMVCSAHAVGSCVRLLTTADRMSRTSLSPLAVTIAIAVITWPQRTRAQKLFQTCSGIADVELRRVFCGCVTVCPGKDGLASQL